MQNDDQQPMHRQLSKRTNTFIFKNHLNSPARGLNGLNVDLGPMGGSVGGDMPPIEEVILLDGDDAVTGLASPKDEDKNKVFKS